MANLDRHFPWEILLATLMSLALIAGASAPSKAQSQEQARGLVRAVNEATLSADISARITALPFREGQTFKKGQTLVHFECRETAAGRRAAGAELKANQIELKNKVYLRKHKAAGAFDIAMAKANLAKSKASVEVADAKLAFCDLKAPFNGRVANWFVRPHETPKPGSPIIRVVSDDDLEIELIVPSNWLIWLTGQDRFFIRIDETGHSYAAQVSRLPAVVDPVSQTAKLLATFTESRDGVVPGMSGTANFLVPTN